MRSGGRILLGLLAAIGAFVVATLVVAAILERGACGFGWLPGWWPAWASGCADDPIVRTARGLRAADWHLALPWMAAAGTFLAVAYPWRGR
ncbi:hypothetical protein [uncultured Jannaschia sp.]|uniref:hypothetical protein n=1 Tax=uncultured Jannaschia sp. TaxID=293347 RepID=UPI00260B5FDD|nr:hypothetical protein [uncultured Jannaschia sp.]